jgi:hypothetical protein
MPQPPYELLDICIKAQHQRLRFGFAYVTDSTFGAIGQRPQMKSGSQGGILSRMVRSRNLSPRSSQQTMNSEPPLGENP